MNPCERTTGRHNPACDIGAESDGPDPWGPVRTVCRVHDAAHHEGGRSS